MAKNGSNLTPKKRRAIEALLKHRTQKDAALAAGIGERTLARWLAEDSNFQAELSRAEGRMIDEATRGLLQQQQNALSVIVYVMADKDTPPGVRLRAAQMLVENMLKLRELRNIEERLTKLEEAVNER